MKVLANTFLSVMIAVSLGFMTMSAQAETASSAPAWDFDREQPGTLPSEFSIGTLFDGRPAGDWQVLATDRAKSPPHVFAQLMAKGAEHAYKVTLVKGTVASDLNLASFVLAHSRERGHGWWPDLAGGR